MRSPRWVLALALAGLVVSPAAFASNGDNFNDNSKDSARWGTDESDGFGVLTERNQRLEYTCATASADDFVIRPWNLTVFPFNWQIQLDVANTTVPALPFQLDSMGIEIFSPDSSDDSAFVELYSSSLNGPPARRGFYASIDDEDDNVGEADSGGFGTTLTNGAILMAFDAATKVITLSYDLDLSDGYQWVEFGTFGLAGSGGVHGNADWGLSETDQLRAGVYGYSAGMVITRGQMSGDNFTETGGVTPAGGPITDPIGNFGFEFPTDNPLLTRIINGTGNYQGISPTSFQRHYSIDVAQDESGKLVFLGTMDGIVDKSGSSEVSGGTGKITTVQGKPTATVQGNFAGTRDGVSTTFKGRASGPVDVVDIGAFTDGFHATATYSGKVGGVPVGDKNLPLAVATPPGAQDNLQQDWNIVLDISNSVVRGKNVTTASAELVLPSGDTIAFAPRKVKYKADKGYTLSFKKGTNTTVEPDAVDKKSSITIKNLTFEQSGKEWTPTGGTILYKFLGQQGSANLLDFVPSAPLARTRGGGPDAAPARQ